MPSPVQSNCDAHDTIANGQYGAVWPMGHTQQISVRIASGNSFSRSAFLRQLICHLLSCGAPVPFADRTIYLASAGVVLLTRPPPCRLHIPVVLNDFTAIRLNGSKKPKPIPEQRRAKNTPSTRRNSRDSAASEEPPEVTEMDIPLPASPQASLDPNAREGWHRSPAL
ncbi:hypothetical protein TNCV_2923361 [Trichonephila clavipes]|nr:hypothetical protein TNCV_2923361 [Trichonephila clavipes]